MNKDWIILLTISLITSLAWIGFEIYRAATQTTIPEIRTNYLEPVDPTLDQDALKIIREANSSKEATPSEK